MTTESTWNGSRFITHGRARWIVLAVLLVVVIGGIVGVALASSNGGSSSSSATGLCNDKLTKMEHSGGMQTMLQQHQAMMEQMRAGLSTRMQQLMNDDPMWKSMRSGEFTQMMQDQQQQIDRMLGAASTCGAPCADGAADGGAAPQASLRKRRSRRGGDLGDDVTAFAAFCEHVLDAAHLTFDAPRH